MKTVIITQKTLGVYAMQVCVTTDATNTEILATCDRDNPPGSQGGHWRNVVRESMCGYEGPVKCSEYPDRIHLLVTMAEW